MKYTSIICLGVFAVIVVLIGLPHGAYAAPSDATPFGGTVRDEFGVNIHFTKPEVGELDMLSNAGFGVIRMDFSWHDTEQQKGVYDFSSYDSLVADLEKHRIRPLFILDYGNPLYNNGGNVTTDDVRSAFTRWAVVAVKHFQGRRIIWEMWNEPNWSDWGTPDKGDGYAKLAVSVGQALQQACPNETYIGPALGGTDPDFLQTCLKDGALNYWKAVSCHPYRPWNPEQADDEIHKLQSLIAYYEPAGAHIPLISGEWGWSVMPVKQVYSYVSTEALQATYLDRQLLNNLYLGIPLSIWYDWRDDHDRPEDTEANFGLVHNAYHAGQIPVFDPKPSYFAAKTLLSLIGDFTYAHSIPVTGSQDAYALVFTRASDRRYAAWTTSLNPEPILLAVPSGMYTIVDMYGKVVKIAGADSKGLAMTVAADPQFVLLGAHPGN
jgi:hypothetical protein